MDELAREGYKIRRPLREENVRIGVPTGTTDDNQIALRKTLGSAGVFSARYAL